LPEPFPITADPIALTAKDSAVTAKSFARIGQPFGPTTESIGLFRKPAPLPADAFGEASICQGRSPEPFGGSA
jgi:hypothetical protein